MLEGNTWSHLNNFVSSLDGKLYECHTWNHMTVCKLFVLRIVTRSYNCAQRIIIIIISYFKPFECELKSFLAEKFWWWRYIRR